MNNSSLSFFSLIFFVCIAYIADILGFILNIAQVAFINGVLGLLSSGVGAAILGVVGAFTYVLDAVGIIDGAHFITPLVLLMGMQFFISLLVFCTYLALSLAAEEPPSLLHFVMVFTVFVIESIPLLSGFTFWTLLAHFFLFGSTRRTLLRKGVFSFNRS